MRRLILYPWNQWYGKEISTQKLLTLGRRIVKVTLKEGYESLRVLSHAPAKTSPYWKDFLSIRRLIAQKRGDNPFQTLCAYSLVDCPAAAISAVAENHNLCLIHHGSEWEWLSHTVSPPKRSIPKSNLLHS